MPLKGCSLLPVGGLPVGGLSMGGLPGGATLKNRPRPPAFLALFREKAGSTVSLILLKWSRAHGLLGIG